MTVTGLSDLLDVQKIDLEIDRLLDRRQSLPELEEYRGIHQRLKRLDRDKAEAEASLRELELTLDKAEGELSILEAKLKEHETRLFAGGMSGRETEYMRLEVESLRGQREALEGRVLQMLDGIDPARETLARLLSKIGEASASRDQLDSAIKTQWSEIDADLGRKEQAKKEAIAPVDPELLDLYDNLRRLKEGVAIASFDHGVCGGCHITLSPSEQEEVLSLDLPRCVHCRRILVP
jgi:uncharacterized protein